MNNNLDLQPDSVPGAEPVSDNLVCFNYHNLEPFFDRFDLVLQAYPGCKFIVFAHNDPYDVEYIKTQILKYNLNKHCVFLVGDLVFAKANVDLGFRFFSFLWHWYYAYRKRHPAVSTDLIRPLNSMPVKRWQKISCLNKSISYPRLLTFYHMNHRYWYNDALTTFNPDWNTINNYNNNLLSGKQLKWYSKRKNLFPYNLKELVDPNRNCWQIDTEPYAGTYLNLVTETFCMSRLVSEKTAKPIAAGCLTQFVAINNFVQLLRVMGFDMDFQGLDHGYDELPTFEERIIYIMRQLDRVWPDIPEIWHINRHRLEHNRTWLLSDQFEDFLLQDVGDLLKLDRFVHV